MRTFYHTPDPRTLDDVVCLFRDAIAYRTAHKDESIKVARFVFDATCPILHEADFGSDIERIRFEFGALEAPGCPEDPNLSLMDSDDRLWSRLQKMVEAVTVW